ncbi:uncharacterized protein MYCGRDRAFT_103360 [Zymoseptoria tritici IPO323]|uniref:Uncharacterized protein n=1 Tax=Zymoseptoria tritici (strain CBS 115943 / IPO323) TaxID=336722 RepID=F9X3U8_ZYMTI|nr:uncharacterized protein MYCGRDRAFT_103360 [Zymoseptoria tritici IPO323]EGP90038.1 hypothetical protein MYCGRDRAFT_103360 [Zymoseptoria tritici IPO323]
MFRSSLAREQVFHIPDPRVILIGAAIPYDRCSVNGAGQVKSVVVGCSAWAQQSICAIERGCVAAEGVPSTVA